MRAHMVYVFPWPGSPTQQVARIESARYGWPRVQALNAEWLRIHSHVPGVLVSLISSCLDEGSMDESHSSALP